MLSEIKEKILFFWKAWIIPFLIALAIVIPVRYVLLEPYVVKGSSMIPNFHDYDYLIVNKWKGHFGEIKRGDIVVLVPPQEVRKSWTNVLPYFDKRVKYIKRVVGLPNETIKLDPKTGYIYIKKVGSDKFEKLDEPYVKDHHITYLREVKLGPNEYYVMGDNRKFSFDSEEFGPIVRSEIIGEPLLRLFPFDKIGLNPARFKE